MSFLKLSQNQKLCFLLLLAALFSCSIGANITVYVDNNAAIGGDGSQSLPFSTLTDAFNQIITNFNLNYDHAEIVVSDNSMDLTLPPVTILGPSTSSLTIKSSKILPQGVILKPEDCSSLPTIQIQSNHQFKVTSLVSVDFVGLNLRPVQSTASNFYDIQNITNLRLSNVCFMDDGNTQALSTMISAYGVQNITVNSLYLSKIYPSTFLESDAPAIDLVNIQILQNLANSSTDFELSVFDFNTTESSGKVSIDGVQLLTNSSTEGIYTVQVMSVISYDTLSVKNFVLTNCMMNATVDLFSIMNVTTIDITNVTLANLGVISSSQSVFNMYNASAIQIDGVSLTQIKSLTDIAEVNWLGIETVNIYIFRAEEFNTTRNESYLNNLLIKDSFMDYIDVLKVKGDFNNFNLTNFELTSSHFRYKTFIFWKFYRYDSMEYTYIDGIEWTIGNFTFYNNTFFDGKLLSFNYFQDEQNDIVLTIGEPDILRMSNITITDSLFSKDDEGTVTYYSYLFSSTGYRFEVDGLTIKNCSIFYYVLFYQSTRLASQLIMNTHISDLTITYSNLFMMNYAGIQVPLTTFDYYDVEEKSIFPQYIVFLFYNSTVKNIMIENSGMSLIMYVAAPFFYMDSNTFQNITASSGRLFEAGFFTPIPTDNAYTRYTRNQEFEEKLFPNHPIMRDLFDNSTYDADINGLGVVYQYRFRNNTIADNWIQLSYSFTKIQSYGYKTSAIKWDQNHFLRNNLGPSLSSHMLWFIFDGHIELKDNIFINTTNQGYLTIFETMTAPLFVNISNNTITGQETAGFVIHRPESIDTFVLADNHVTDSVLYITFINLIPVSSQNRVSIIRNSFSNLQVFSSNLTASRINFIYLEIPMPLGNSVVEFGSNVLENITLTKKDSYIKGSFDNSLINMVLGNSTLNIWNCTFKDTAVREDGSYMSITSGSMNITNSTFKDITTSGKYGTIYALSPNITIDTSTFFHNNGLQEVRGGVIFIDYDPTYTVDAISLTVTNNVFQSNSADKGSVVYVENTNLRFSLHNNTFVDNYASNFSGAIQFYYVEFLTFDVFHNTINASEVEGRLYAKNFMLLDNTRGTGYINQSHIHLSGDISMDFITLYGSSHTHLKVNNLTVLQGQPISFQGSRRILSSEPVSKHFSLITSDSGSIDLTDVNLSNAFLSKASVFDITCSNQTNNITVTNSTFSNITQRGESNSIYVALVNRSDLLQTATTGGLFFTDPLNSKNTCNISITIQDSLFHLIKQDGSGGVINDLASGPTLMNIIRSNFTNITAGQGPAISTYSPDNSSVISIVNSTFESNQANGYGGVIFNIAAKIYANDSQFVNNVANYSGGAIFSYFFDNADEILNKSGNTFINNTFLVKGGSNLAARPKSLLVTFSQEDYRKTGMIENYVNISSEVAQQSVLLLTNLTTYTLQEATFQISIFDELGQPIYDISVNPKPTIYFNVYLETKNLSFTSSNCTYVNNATMCFINDKNIQIYGNSQSEVGNISINYMSRDISLTTMIQVQTRDCIKGEVYNSRELTCELCPFGKYSLNPTDTYCFPCPEGANCTGGYYIEVLKNNWRANTNTAEILYCDGTSERCAGTYDSLCFDGFIGTLCSQCDLNNGYVRQGSPSDINCGKCPAPWKTILLNLLYMLGMFAYNLYYINNLVHSNRTYYKAIKDNLPTPSSTGPYIRGITTYLQIITIVSSFNAGFMSAFGESSDIRGAKEGHPTELFYNQDCFYSALGVAPDNQLKAKIILSLLMPIIKLIIVATWYLSRWKFTLSPKRKIRLFVTWISIFIIEQPGIVQALIAYSSCAQIHSVDPQYYVYANEFFKCDIPEYNSFYYFVVLPFLSFYFAIMPALMLGALIYNKNNLNSEKIRLALGGLFNEYTPQAYYWGVAIIAFKLFLIVINQMFSNDIKSKALILLLVFYVYKALLSWKQPYYDPKLMMAETLSIYAYMLTVFCSYLFIQNKGYIKILCLLGILVANALAIGFIGKQLYLISREAFEKVTSKFKKRPSSAIEAEGAPSSEGGAGSPDNGMTTIMDGSKPDLEMTVTLPAGEKEHDPTVL